MITIIVPTYNESKNLPILVKDLLKIKAIRILVVDDNSPDGTGEIAEKLKKTCRRVNVLHRKNKSGLGSAILDGFKAAETDIVGVMDADLSHPPETLRRMIEKIKDYDVVVASRYIPGGGADEKWTKLRRLISKSAILLVKPIAKIKDPMSGFFLVKKSVIDGVSINPDSCKICLEIMVKGKYKNFIEVPFIFINRKAGKSKIMTPKEISRYIRHVMNLYVHSIRKKF
ncbi:MAG: polyprenol monophosphomannose synthase [Candidatus Aenigmatarchaeota archaeon]